MQHNKSNSLVPMITHIMYQFPENIESYSPGSKHHHVEVILKDDKYWIPVYFAPGSAEYSEPSIEDPNGKIFNQQLKFRVPGDNTDELTMLENIDTLPVILKITYSNGNEKIMGEPENPAIYISDYSSNAKATGSTHIFKSQSSKRIYVLETTDPPGSGGPPPAVPNEDPPDPLPED